MADEKNNAGRSGESVEESTVWHYTNIESACKILDGMNMRATYYPNMNDRQDVKFGFDIAMNVLKDKSFSTSNIKDNILNAIIGICQAKYQHLFYIMCFSEDGDSIAQWQGYTDHKAGGCALGFKKNSLVNFFTNDKLSPPRNIQCCYINEVEKDQMVANIIKEHTEEKIIQKLSSKKAKEMGATTLEYKELEEVILNDSFFSLSDIALGAKHPGFAHEKELRLVFQAPFNDKTNKYEIEHDDSFSKLFITCPFNKNFMDTLTSIRLSPHGNKEYNRMCIENVLLLHPEYKKIDIDESQMPYRGSFK